MITHANKAEFKGDGKPDRPVLSPGEVHVWEASLGRSSEFVTEMQTLLSSDELQRANRFVFDQDRNHFIIARAFLRLILENYSGISAQNLSFVYTDAGKPSLCNVSTLDFNLSHSCDRALYAITTGPVGVDIEKINPEIPCKELSARFFSKEENDALNSLPDEEGRIQAFFRCWTRKEAYIKAIGGGLSIPLNQFSVSVLPGECASIGEDCKWDIRDIQVDSLYAAAVVAAAPVSEIQLFHFTDFSTELRTDSQKI